MATIKFTVEPIWTDQVYTDEIEIDDEDLEGMTVSERKHAMERYVEETVIEATPWSWEEV